MLSYLFFKKIPIPFRAILPPNTRWGEGLIITVALEFALINGDTDSGYIG